MKYKGILLDIDHTIYNYNYAHEISLESLLEETHIKTRLNKLEIKYAYIKARSEINNELAKTASSHNRLLYIQRMLELLKVNCMNIALSLYEAYWGTFISVMKPYDGVNEFLSFCDDTPICLVTDLTAHIQHRKIEALQLYKYAKYLITSEEVGKEKPDPDIFIKALKKLDLNAEHVCMIGDNYKKDILGASSLGIKSFWLNKDNRKENIHSNLIVEFKCFYELKGMINE